MGRIVSQYRRRLADSMGDPHELYEAFRAQVSRYAEKAPLAKRYLEAFQEVQKLMAAGASAEKLKEVRHRGMVETMEPDASGRSPTRDLAYEVTTHGSQHGWGKISSIASKLCLAVLQQLVLPPKLRKSIEAIAKFYDREPRMNLKGKTYEETLAKRVGLYLDFLEDFRKHEKVFEMALREGHTHLSEGEGATQIKAGPFTLVNTGGFDHAKMENVAKLVEEAAHKMKALGLGKVCYGNVNVTNRISGNANVQAFYYNSNDEMFVRADAKAHSSTVRIVCHELTHRLDHKFLQSKQHEIAQLYKTINTHSTYMSETEMPEYGAPISYKGELWKVMEKDTRRRSLKLAPANPLRCFVCAEKGRSEHVPDEEHKFPIARKEVLTMPVEAFYKLQGKTQKVDPLDFITPYAKKGGPAENFCEMVSFLALGELPKEQVDLLAPILG